MTAKELREKFLRFFEKKGHKIVPSSSLIPEDPSVLFTTAGMQQFKPYFLGEKSPYGKNVASSCQKCFRTSDIEAVGDEKHLTFLEMLGNFSFGQYFKEEALNFAFEFLFEELKLKKDDFNFTVFGGDHSASLGQVLPFDEESFLLLKKLKIPESKIRRCGRADNFWGPTGKEGPCGPTVEFHVNDTELWNLVFNEYYQDEKGNLTPLEQKGVDTGMGLERLAMVVQGKLSVFETDLFLPIIKSITSPGLVDKQRAPDSLIKAQRIISDHIKSSVFLISEDVFPSNVERGYVLRRILRRAIRFGKILNLPKNFLIPLAQKVVAIYKDVYPEVKLMEVDILTVIQNETEKFEKTLVQGLKELKLQIEDCKTKKMEKIPGKVVFDLYQSYGFPLELTQELAKEEGFEIDEEGFEEEFKKHQEISRAGAEKKFGGIGPEATYEATKLHTATHLLHASLREVLGLQVKQMGSDITSQRLRFDFSHPQKMTPEQIKKTEDLVNQKIKEDLEVKRQEMDYDEAIKSGALAFFKEKYPEKVSVYSCGDFSKEICAGPHVKRTSELGHFKIKKEESSGSGIRRVRAILQ